MIRQDCHDVSSGQHRLIGELQGEEILVTGGTGFLGTWISELITYLNDEYGFKIHLHLMAQNIEAFKKKAPHLAKRKDVSLIEQDVTCISELPVGLTHIIHAAGNPDNRMHASDPLIVAQVIANGTFSLLEAAIRLQNLKKIVNVSSGLVYGPQPLDLERIPEGFKGGPDCSSSSSVYAEAKRYGEVLCAIFRARYKLDIVNVRPFAFIGPYQLLDRPWAINNFIRDGILGGPIRILGDGSTVRSYMYASDMAFWLLKALCSGKNGATFNIGSPEAITLMDAALKIADVLDGKPVIKKNEGFSDQKNRSVFVPDVSSAHSLLGLKITVPIDAAIQKTIRWNKHIIGKGN